MATKDQLRREFAKRLQAELKDRGWSQSDLARKMFGQTKGGGAKGRDNVSGYCLGRSLPTARHLKMLCDALGAKESDLIPEGLEAASRLHGAPFRMEATAEGKVWLDVHQEVPIALALKIAQLLNEDRS